MPPSRWPHGAKAAISFTMDNLGEAQDVRTGTWPADQPHGTHPAVLTILPRILDLLDDDDAQSSSTTATTITKNGQEKPTKIKATYFAETWSLPVYPAAVAALQARGHEVAWHGFQHEVWHALSDEAEQANFAKSFALAAAAKPHPVQYHGFRPPGGTINGTRTVALCQQYGVRYVSPLGTFGILKSGDGDSDSDGGNEGVVVLPFEWETVDAFWYMDKFASLRREHGVQEAPLGPEAFRTHLFHKLEAVVQEGGYLSILFHPFLTTSEEKFGVLEEVLQRLRGDPNIWVAPCNEVARWVSEHADLFGF